MTIRDAKQSVLDILDRWSFPKKNPDVTYAIAYFFLLIRALIGPIMEFVHVFVDTKYYLEIINCEGLKIFFNKTFFILNLKHIKK